MLTIPGVAYLLPNDEVRGTLAVQNAGFMTLRARVAARHWPAAPGAVPHFSQNEDGSFVHNEEISLVERERGQKGAPLAGGPPAPPPTSLVK